MRIEYNKLIRDRIPEIIAAEGKQYGVEVMDDQEYRQGLLIKLVEEAQEAAAAAPDKLIIELADLMEVIQATIKAFEMSVDEVNQVRHHRKIQRGGFEKKLKLIWVA